MRVILAALLFFNFSVISANSVPVPNNGHDYTLTKVDSYGENTIIKYEWSEVEKRLVPVYYRLDLNKTSYGNVNDPSDVKSYTVTVPSVDGSSNAFEYQIDYHIDSNRLSHDKVLTEQDYPEINLDLLN